MKKFISVAFFGAVLALSSCHHDKEWGINGKISGISPEQTVLIEGINQGSWYLIDTLKVDKTGKFSYRHAPQGYPDIYRLRLGNESIYFPIDSVETINIESDASSFASASKISGSLQTENMTYVDSLINASVKAKGVDATLTDEGLKRALGEMLISDPAGIVSYYLISKQVGGKPLFNPSVNLDKRLIGAVANAYSGKRPSDPRTSYLKRLFLANRPLTVNSTIEASEIGAFDINLFDQTGKQQSLSQFIDKGKTILVNFTAYQAQESPAFNVILADLYKKYHDAGLEIYQVSVDNDEYRWREAAKNLPWITVLAPAHDSSVLRLYNVSTIPTTFIIDRSGQIVERVEDPAKLASAVSRYM
ncbi:MAG: TlpA family protein disulfide reductase [Duncaniella sp.]|nr:TlpA family protein disulfide reductase [Duncaniella sp.]